MVARSSLLNFGDGASPARSHGRARKRQIVDRSYF
jgi:hypothetical protein